MGLVVVLQSILAPACYLPGAAWAAAKRTKTKALMLRLVNTRILRDGKLVDDDVWIDAHNGTVVDPMRRFYEAKSSKELEQEQKVDCHGAVVAPGFIDLQLNGCYGIDFSNVEQMKNRENIRKCCRELVKTGVTAFCPTLISLKPHEYKEILQQFAEFLADDQEQQQQNQGARILGLHLEGPFFNPAKIGAHPAENILSPENGLQKTYQHDLDNVCLFTLAPEQPGALDVIRDLRAKGITVSIGHSGAALAEADAGISAGASMITHLFNAMGAFHHRDPGIIGLLGRHQLRDRVNFGIICDGLHVNPASVAMAYQSHRKGAVLITDAMSGMGLPTGTHALGSQQVEITWAQQPDTEPVEVTPDQHSVSSVLRNDDGTMGARSRTNSIGSRVRLSSTRKSKKAVVSGTDTLAGSVVSMEECVQNFHIFTGCSIAETLEAATSHPARVLGLPATQGNLNFGSVADFVVLDPHTLQVWATFRNGHCVYQSPKMPFAFTS